MATTSSSACLNPQAPEFLPAVAQIPPYKSAYPLYFAGSTDYRRPMMYYYNAFALFPYTHHVASFKGPFSGEKVKAEPAGITAGDGKERKYGLPFGFRGHNRNFLPPRLKKPKVWAVKSKTDAISEKLTSSHGDRDHDGDDKLENLLAGKTSVMIRNIPNKFGRNDLLKILDDHCREMNIQARCASDKYRSSYDFLYLPMDFVKRANLGYAFVNFTSSVAAVKFFRHFNKFFWSVPGNRKICEITPAKYQGKEQLTRHFKDSRFTCHTDTYLPVVLSPPSDGFVPYRLTLLGERTGVRSGASLPPPSVNCQEHHRDV